MCLDETFNELYSLHIVFDWFKIFEWILIECAVWLWLRLFILCFKRAQQDVPFNIRLFTMHTMCTVFVAICFSRYFITWHSCMLHWFRRWLFFFCVPRIVWIWCKSCEMDSIMDTFFAPIDSTWIFMLFKNISLFISTWSDLTHSSVSLLFCFFLRNFFVEFRKYSACMPVSFPN